MFDVGVEEELGKTSRKDRQGPNKRAKKDEKYGHGGKKRFKKSGDAQSTGDLRGFSSKKMKGVVKQRPGKARRAGKQPLFRVGRCSPIIKRFDWAPGWCIDLAYALGSHLR